MNDKLSDLVAVGNLDDRSDEILDAVAKLVDEHTTVDKSDFVRLIAKIDQADVAAVLTRRVSQASGEARTALRLLEHLNVGTIGEVITQIDEAAAERLRDWDESVVDALVNVRGNRKLSAALDTVVDEMANGDDAARAKALKLKPKRSSFLR